MDCTITDEYTRRGADVIFLENSRLSVEVLAGKGGDVTEIRDKRTNINVLYESPAEWHVPGDGYRGLSGGTFDFMDYYPGGWQDVLPCAGGPATVSGAPYPLHGESSLVPWETTRIEETAERVSVTLSLSLTRYPLEIERTYSLQAGDSRLVVEEEIVNVGEIGVDYSWLQHIAFGAPLIGPDSSLEVPCETVVSDPGHDVPNSRFPPAETFEWPVCELADRAVDLRTFPEKDARIHDLLALKDLSEGRYTITNERIDLTTTVTFPEDVFKYIWYWAPLGGFEGAPYFGRNYNLGLEPCTSIPNAGLDEQIENGTADHLAAGESRSVTLTVETAPVP